MSSLALLTRILHQTPTSERSALFAEQCNSLAVAQDFEDAHDLLRALLADGQLSSDEAVSLFDTFLARYLELKRLDATSLALAKSVYVTFLENCTVLRVRLLVQIPSLLAEHKFLAPAADPVVNQLDETSNGSMCTDAADALALACRLAQGGHFTTAQVTELYEHSLTGLVCFDRETRTAAASALPVFLLALSRDAPVNSHISTIMDRTLPLMASHPVLLAETAQVLTAILAVPELVVAGGALSVAAKSGAVICALLASVVLLESGPRKYAIHALHQFVDAARPVPTSAKVGKKRFKAITATTATAAQPPYVLQDSLFAAPAWEQWFLAYDLISESYQHMVKSAFAILDQEVVRSLAGTNGESGAVPFEWWLAVLQRGLLNDSLSSRKQVVTYVLSLPDSALEALCRHQAFLDRILEVLPAPGFFAINVQGAYVSPFGEKCSRFIANLLVMAPSLASSIVQHLAATRSTVWLLYGIQGLAQAAQKGAPIVTTFDQALAIANLTLNRSPTSEPARHFLDQQVMDVLVALQGDLRAVGTAKHMLTLVSRLKHFGHPAIAMWANSFEPADAVLEEIEALSTVPGSLGHVREAADCMAHLFAVLLPKDQLRIRERVIELVEELYSRPYLDAGVAEQRIAVLVALSDPEIDRRVAPSVTAFLAAKMSPAAISTVDALQVLSAALEHYAAHISDPDQLSHHALAILQADAENDTVPVQLTKNFALVGLSIARPPRLAFSDISPLRLQRPAHAPERWNDMISRFVSLKWEVIADILQASSDNGNVSASAVDALLDEIDNDHRESSIALIECAARLIDVDQHPGCFERALASVWQLVKSSASIPRHFYVLYPAFVAFLCTPKFVTHPTLHGAITTVMSNIVKLGATRFGVIDLMVAKLAPTLAADPELAWSFRSTIIDWLMFGPLRDRDEDRLETVWLKKLGQDYGGNPDYNVRVYANLLAAHIAGTAHGPKFFDLLLDSVFAPARNPAMEFPNQLVNREKLRLLSTLLMLAPTCVTVSSSSRIFERVISVLEGEPAVNLRPYYEWLLVLVGLHDAPECFRILSEQLGGYNDRAGKVTSLLLVAGHLLRALDDWTRMPAPGHVLTPSLSMDENSVQLAELVDMVLLRVPPWLASNHFAVRLHAQWILVRAWTICTRWCQSHYSFVEHFGGRKDTADLVQFMSTNKDCVKFKAKYLDPTYLTNDFHPVRDLNLEFVFHLLPRMANDNAADEHISSRAFRHAAAAAFALGLVYSDGEDSDCLVPIVFPIVASKRQVYLRQWQVEDLTTDPIAPDFVAGQPVAVVATLEKGPRAAATTPSSSTTTPAAVDSIATASNPALPVQRKINTFAGNLSTHGLAMVDCVEEGDGDDDGDEKGTDQGNGPSDGGILAKLQTAVRTQGLRGRLDVIVCASLVELTTNLGGLARTSEIFGLRELTVHSKRVVDDPLFRSLAVSADRHLPIREVTRSDLPAWLRTMKREHQYSVVALEQTSASVPLERLTAFPQKVILLLGKEREGIPADLLAAGDIVDLCIEIPQLGVTRSLNVHNSAVILIWEYVRRLIS